MITCHKEQSEHRKIKKVNQQPFYSPHFLSSIRRPLVPNFPYVIYLLCFPESKKKTIT